MASVGTVLFLCRANVCRSPMAAIILSELASAAGLELVAVSAGLKATEGHAVAPEVALELVSRSIRMPDPPHLSHRVTPADLSEADLVVTASGWMRDSIASVPGVWGKAFLMGELPVLLGADAGGPATAWTVPDLAAELDTRRRRRSPGAVADLPDPQGGPPEGYAACAEVLLSTLQPVVDALSVRRVAD